VVLGSMAMEAATWTVVGILGAAVLGLATLFTMAIEAQTARLDRHIELHP